MLKIRNIINATLLIGIIFLGSFLSLNVGISHDELHEQLNWQYNIILIKNTIYGLNIETEYLDKYYGVGINYLSQPIQYLFGNLHKYTDISQFGFKLILKHPVIFILFFISSIFFYKILKKITLDKNFSKIATIFYILYPYLLGHSFFNSKDIPFLSFWLICTYLSCNLIKNIDNKNIINLSKITILALSTSFLLSIRISGVLILFQYLFTLIIFLNLKQTNLELKKQLFKKISFFIFICLIFTYLLYPVIWKNPLELINAVKFMSQHHNDICTFTLGKCMQAQNLDSSYIYLWLLVKLPFILILGFLLLPFTEKKIFTNDHNKIFFGTLLLSIFFIPLILILFRVPLYDEIRQILFLIPLFFLVGITSIYFFLKKKTYLILIFFIAIFIYENVKIFPYQYTWFNYPARFIEIEGKFELDYWGISGKKLASKFEKINFEKNCLASSPSHSVKPFLEKKGFECFFPWNSINKKLSRPFYAIQLGRNLRSSLPYKCDLVHKETIELPLHTKKLTMGNLIKCN